MSTARTLLGHLAARALLPLFAGALAALLLVPRLALGQTLDAPPEPDLAALAGQLLDAIVAGQWWPAAALALSVVVALVRRYGGARWPILASDRAGAALVLLLGFLGAAATALAAGTPVGLPLVLAALKVSLSSAGGYAVIRRLLGAPAIAQAEAAGAAAVVTSPPGGVEGIVGAPRTLQ